MAPVKISNLHSAAAPCSCGAIAVAAGRLHARRSLPPPPSAARRTTVLVAQQQCIPGWTTAKCRHTSSCRSRHVAHRPPWVTRAQAPAAAEAESTSDSTDETAAGESGDSLVAANLTAPAARTQPKLSAKERAQRRGEAEEMVRQRKMVQVQIGAAGVTPPVLATLMDVLVKRSFVRVRCGVGRGERGALAQDLERLLDAEVVHQIGFTITLFRQQGLARPSGCSCTPEP